MTDAPPLKPFANGAQAAAMVRRYREGFVRSVTTNPTLMNKARIREYQALAKEVVAVVVDLLIYFEVFADDFAEMERQALLIAGWVPKLGC